MNSRDERMIKRNERMKANKFSTNSAPPEIIDDTKAEAEAEAEIIPFPPSIIIRHEDVRNPDRQVIILPYERDELWEIPNIAYFRSSGTSNEGCGWLCGTFFPTGGITTKIKLDEKTRINDECVGTGGHLLKMSDITNRVCSSGVVRSIDSFYTAFATELNIFLNQGQDRTRITAPTIIQLFDAFSTYFLSEQQLLLSYRLSFAYSEEGLHHIGLWGWKCTNTNNNETFKLSDFCNTRWGGRCLPISIPNRVEILNSVKSCEFIKRHSASVNFEEMRIIIFAHNRDPNTGRQLTMSTGFRNVLLLDRMFSQTGKGGLQKRNKITNKRKRKGYKRFKTIRKNM